MLSRPAMHMVISNFGHLLKSIPSNNKVYRSKLFEFYLPTVRQICILDSYNVVIKFLESCFLVVSNHQKRCVEKKNMNVVVMKWEL